MSMVTSVTTVNVLCGFSVLWVLSKVIQYFRRRARSTPLAGPPNPNLFLGASRFIMRSPDAGIVYEEWAKQYGSVFRVPAAFGLSRVVLCDPKAISHFYSRETYGYVQTTVTRRAIEGLVGRGVIWAEGDSHKRQRKALSPAFSNAAIRKMTSIFYDSAYKVKTAWDGIIMAEPSDSAVIDVESWMNQVSLDTIGIAGFSHDFGTLHGKHSTVASTFDAFATLKPGLLSGVQFIIGIVFPWILKVPTAVSRLVKQLNASMGEIAQELLANTRNESEGEDKTEEKSIIGLLIKAEKSDSELYMSEEEVLAQMKVLILAGYETTSSSLTWALIEICKGPEIQTQLREELSKFSDNDPTWDQFTNGLPYLDAIVHETLRLHPPVGQTTRMAAEDDVIPLSTPMQTPSGAAVDHIAIAKGQLVTVPIHAMNKSAQFWGADAKAFRPERWLDAENGIPKRGQEIQGHKHLLTFVDGPRICLGRHFALAEFKAVLSVLIRNYEFQFRDGPDTKIEVVRGVLPRPGVAGEDGAKVPLRVRRLD